MPEIRTLAKPEIYLLGSCISGGGQKTGEFFSGVVDHSKNSGTSTIISTTQLNKNDPLTFKESVRIIITGQLTPKPNYTRKNTGPFPNTSYEGKQRENIINVNEYAETYYTLNGKDPVRNASYLYKYTDRDDLITTDKTETLPPTDTNPSLPGDIFYDNNLNTLGFVLKNINSGDSVITLKARTFFQGRASSIAVAYFKIYRSPTYSTIINNSNNNI